MAYFQNDKNDIVFFLFFSQVNALHSLYIEMNSIAIH